MFNALVNICENSLSLWAGSDRPPMFNEDAAELDDDRAMKPSLRTRMTLEQMKIELEDRENKMKYSSTKKETDQWRVYQHIVSSIERGEYLRLMVQASAGTGKSFLLTQTPPLNLEARHHEGPQGAEHVHDQKKHQD